VADEDEVCSRDGIVRKYNIDLFIDMTIHHIHITHHMFVKP